MIKNSTSIDKTYSHKGKRDACIPIKKKKNEMEKQTVESNKTHRKSHRVKF